MTCKASVFPQFSLSTTAGLPLCLGRHYFWCHQKYDRLFHLHIPQLLPGVWTKQSGMRVLLMIAGISLQNNDWMFIVLYTSLNHLTPSRPWWLPSEVLAVFVLFLSCTAHLLAIKFSCILNSAFCSLSLMDTFKTIPAGPLNALPPHQLPARRDRKRKALFHSQLLLNASQFCPEVASLGCDWVHLNALLV